MSYALFSAEMESSFQPHLEGDLYIRMFQDLIGVLWAKDNSGNSIKLWYVHEIN